MALEYPKKKVLGTKILELLLLPFLPLLIRRTTETAKPERSERKRFLIIEPFGLGDLVYLTAMLEPIKKRYPEAFIGVVCDSKWKEFLENHRDVDKVHDSNLFWSTHNKSLNLKSLYDFFKFCLVLRKEKYDVGFDIRGDIRSVYLLVAAGCQERVGFLDYIGSNITTRGLLLTHSTHSGIRSRFEELSSLLECAGIPAEGPLRINLGTALTPKDKTAKLKVGIHIGAGWKYKRWRSEQWVKVVHELNSQKEYHIVLLGTPAEQTELSEINRACARECEQVETKEIKTLINEISNLDLLICMDSAPLHLALGCNVPTVALFGPGVIPRWSPPNPLTRVIHHQAEYSCAPCTQLQCVHPDFNCMDRIEADEVLEAVNRVIQKIQHVQVLDHGYVDAVSTEPNKR